MLNLTLLNRYPVKSTHRLAEDLLSTQHKSKLSNRFDATTENNLNRKTPVKAEKISIWQPAENIPTWMLKMLNMHSLLEHRQQSLTPVQQIGTTPSFRSSLQSFHLLPDPLPVPLQPQEDRSALLMDHQCSNQAEVYDLLWTCPNELRRTTQVLTQGSAEAHCRSKQGHSCSAQGDSTPGQRNQCNTITTNTTHWVQPQPIKQPQLSLKTHKPLNYVGQHSSAETQLMGDYLRTSSKEQQKEEQGK